jgi:hypothetical protein
VPAANVVVTVTTAHRAPVSLATESRAPMDPVPLSRTAGSQAPVSRAPLSRTAGSRAPVGPACGSLAVVSLALASLARAVPQVRPRI